MNEYWIAQDLLFLAVIGFLSCPVLDMARSRGVRVANPTIVAYLCGFAIVVSLALLKAA
jgi:hypothetical protein